jgi:hypothetical protein
LLFFKISKNDHTEPKTSTSVDHKKKNKSYQLDFFGSSKNKKPNQDENVDQNMSDTNFAEKSTETVTIDRENSKKAPSDSENSSDDSRDKRGIVSKIKEIPTAIKSRFSSNPKSIAKQFGGIAGDDEIEQISKVDKKVNIDF